MAQGFLEEQVAAIEARLSERKAQAAVGAGLMDELRELTEIFFDVLAPKRGFADLMSNIFHGAMGEPRLREGGGDSFIFPEER
jgi:hypothetical protein